MRVPVATYRLQLHRGVPFDAARGRLAYLQALDLVLARIDALIWPDLPFALATDGREEARPLTAGGATPTREP